MNKKIRRRNIKTNYTKMSLVLFLLLFSTLGLLTGCDGNGSKRNPYSKPAVAFLIQNTANSKQIDLSAPMLQDIMMNCAENFGFTFVVRIDGSPELVAADSLDVDPQYKNASPERLKIDAKNKVNNLRNMLDNLDAVYPEVDFLEGLRCAASSLRSLDNMYTSHSIVVLGTGLSTAGYLDFRNNLLSAEPGVIVEMLKQRDALPDLKGISIYWIGMSQVTEPQPRLTPKQTNNLLAIWKEIVESAGGEFVNNTSVSLAVDDPTGVQELPPVSVVDLPPEHALEFMPEVLLKQTNQSEQSEQSEQPDDNAFVDPVFLGEEQVKFNGDKATYLNPEKALEVIKPIAEYLIQHDSVTLLLVGSTAGDETSNFAMRLSAERAEAVKKSLVQFGVDEHRLKTLGMGSQDPWHIKNAGYNTPASSLNRKVVLLDGRTDLAIKLINNDT